MRNFFEPASGAPSWLRQVLSSIRAALGDIWPAPLRLKDYAAADLPAAADFAQGLAYNLTSLRIAYSNGAAWTELQPYDATLAGLSALTVAQGDLIYGTGAGSVAVLAKNASASRYLSNGGASNNPAWAQIDLSNGVTGDLPFANIAQISTAKVLGRATAGTGDIEQLATTGSGSVVLSGSPVLSGPVGIGGIAASFDLEIFGSAANAALRSSGTASAGVRGYVNGAEAGKVAFLNGGGIDFEVAGVSRMTLGAGGLALVSPLAVGQGGTGATTAGGARTNLGLGTAATRNTGTSGANVPLLDGANLWGAHQTISVGVAGAGGGDPYLTLKTTDYAAGKSRLTFESSAANVWGMYLYDGTTFGGGTLNVSVATFNITGALTISNPLAVAQGGTGATSAGSARTNLGLGTAATQGTGTSGHNLPFLDGTNTFSALQSLSSGLNVAGGIKETGTISFRIENSGASGPPTGATGQGIEFFQTGMQSYNRSTFAYGGFNIDASSVAIRPGGAAALTVAAALITAAQPVRLPSYTVAGLPSATTAGDGAIVFASNGRKTGEGAGAGTGLVVYADGGTWYRFADDSAVAA